jgi:hemolysin activation/secretion protein
MSKTHRLSPFTLALCALALSSTTAALAQQAPDAGRILQDLQLPQQVLPESLNLQLDAPPVGSAGADEGPAVQLKTVRINGASHIETARLQALLAPAVGQSHSLAGLRALADQITRFYREQGFPFARAFVPAQRMTDGELAIEVIEGRYGQVSASANDAELAADAGRFLADLHSGDVITLAPLERTMLVLSDLPGIRVRPVVRPGQTVGTGDLAVEVERTKAFEGRVTVDNHGNRYSGQHRVLLEGAWNNPFSFGDRLNAALMATDEDLFFGNLNYSRALGTSGLRGDIGYAVSDYTLGGEFSSLQASGTARVTSAGMSYPLVRSNRANLLLSAQAQHKTMVDEYGATATRNEKSSQVLPLTLQFDLRDALLGGGITYGMVGWTHGRISLKGATRVDDQGTARTHGAVNKVNLDVTRLQALSAQWTLSARVSAQWSGKNLDSSEDFVLGGAGGVRAYPRGEGSGDEGVLGQIELRYGQGTFVPYAFWDAGQSTLNRRPWTTDANHRSLAGGGLGVRAQHGNWSLDGTLAWQHAGGDAKSDSQQRSPRVWVTAAYRF